MNDLVMGGTLGEFQLSSVLEALSLSRQHVKISLWDRSERPSGELRVKAGQVLKASCRGEGGQPAFRLLLRLPHHSFRVEKLPEPLDFPQPVGSLHQLFGSATEQVQSPAAAEPRAANVPQARVATSPRATAGSELARRSARPSLPQPNPAAASAQPRPSANQSASSRPAAAQGQRAPGDSGRQGPRLRPCASTWAESLSQISCLRALILIPGEQTDHGEYWSQGGPRISMAELAEFGLASVRAQAMLPAVWDPLAPTGYRLMAEHRLGCIVTDIDISRLIRVFLFDPFTPLGVVRYFVEEVIALSGGRQPRS